MASDIDQSLSLKAQLKDEISPALRKMNASIKTTQEALKELGTSTEQLSQTIGSSTQNMADSNSRSAEKLQEDLKKTGGAFQDLSKEARTSSREVGEALKEAFSMGGQGKTVSEMDNELEGLKRTLEGMASTSRPITSKSKNVKALGTDTLNRKVIPAFTALHDTLDDFPDTLGGITAAGDSGARSAGKLQEALSSVNERVTGLGKTFDRLKVTILDVVGAVATSFFGVQGFKLRDIQTSAAKKRGIGAFDQARTLAPVTQLLSQAPDDVWRPAWESLMDMSEEAMHAFPVMIRHMTNLSKTTGIATDEFARMFVEMKEISNLSGEEWVDVTKKINFFASNSRATIEEIQQALAGSTEEMLGFSRAARKAYAEHSMTVAAQSASAGIGAGAGGDMFRTLQRDMTARQQAYGLLNSQGMGGFDINEAMRSGDIVGTFGNIADALTSFVNAEKAAGRNIQEGVSRQAFEARFGGFASPEMALRLAERAQELGPGGFREEAARLEKEGKNVNFESLAGLVRSTPTEQIEKIMANVGATGMQIGDYTMQAMEAGLDPLVALSANLAAKFNEMPEMARQGIAFFTLGLNVMSALQHAEFLPESFRKAISGALETTVGAALVAQGLSTQTGEESLLEQIAQRYPGLPFMEELALKIHREKLDERSMAPGGIKTVYPDISPRPGEGTPFYPDASAVNKPMLESYSRVTNALFDLQQEIKANPEYMQQDPRVRYKLAQEAMQNTQDYISRASILANDNQAAKVQLFEENVRPKLRAQYEEMSKMKKEWQTQADIGVEEAKTKLIDLEELRQLMEVHPQKLFENKGLLDESLGKYYESEDGMSYEAKATAIQQMYQEQIKTLLAKTDAVQEQLITESMNTNKEFISEQQETNRILGELVSAVVTLKLNPDDVKNQEIIDRLTRQLMERGDGNTGTNPNSRVRRSSRQEREDDGRGGS